ncbi:unnamed protein product, partial [Symbiodinium sp. CCMP2456]
VSYYMEQLKDPLTSDICIPAWAAQSVRRQDQAYFEERTHIYTAALWFQTDADAAGAMDVMDEDAEKKAEESQKNQEQLDAWSWSKLKSMRIILVDKHKLPSTMPRNHILLDIKVPTLAPMRDVQARLDDCHEKQKAVEKTIRGWITQSEKAAAKALAKKQKAAKKNAKKGQKAQAADTEATPEEDATDAAQASQAVELLTAWGMAIPEKPADQVAAIRNMLDREDKLEDATSAGRSNRARLMQAALEQAQMKSGSAAASSSASSSEVLFGPTAAVEHATTEGIVKQKVKKSKIAKSDIVTQVFLLGKHILK